MLKQKNTDKITDMNKYFSFVFEVVKITVIALLIVLPLRYFLFQPFFVNGQSMEPNFSQNDYLIIDEMSYRLGDPERGDIVVFKYPEDPSKRFIKRVIGLPGETVDVSNGQVIINGKDGSKVLDETGYLPYNVFTTGNVKISMREDEYFVMGDNRAVSFDSRSWGILPRKNIIGKVFLRVWPFTSLHEFNTLDYNN